MRNCWKPLKHQALKFQQMSHGKGNNNASLAILKSPPSEMNYLRSEI